MADLNQILDSIKELKLLEVAELVKMMEEEFGVSAAAAVVAAAVVGAAVVVAASEEQAPSTPIAATLIAPAAAPFRKSLRDNPFFIVNLPSILRNPFLTLFLF